MNAKWNRVRLAFFLFCVLFTQKSSRQSGRVVTILDKIFLVGIGGAVGSILRFVVSGWVQSISGISFPFGTLVVNVVGCFIIGILSYLADVRGVLTPDEGEV